LNRFSKHNVPSYSDVFRRLPKRAPIAAVLEIADRYTRKHAWRVAIYARRLAERIGLKATAVENIRLGGLLHDIGKIGLSAVVLNNTQNWLSDDMLAELGREKVRSVKNIIELIGQVHPELKVSKQGPKDLRVPMPK